MAGFDDVRFPVEISWGSTGGPTWSTTLIALRNGSEARNGNWSTPRHRYNVAKGVQSTEEMAAVKAFFIARRGRLYGFRYKDWADFKSSADGSYRGTVTATDQGLGTGNGVQTAFQLVKLYADAIRPYTRTITRPVAGTVRIAVNGVERLAGDVTYPWSVDTATGIVTFTLNPPPVGQAVAAGFEFDVPARFDVDEDEVALEAWNANTVELPIVEIREC